MYLTVRATECDAFRLFMFVADFKVSLGLLSDQLYTCMIKNFVANNRNIFIQHRL